MGTFSPCSSICSALSHGPDQDRLERDLMDFFIREGGVVKDTKVKEWKFHKNSPWCLELDSFERVVHPEKLAFFSERLDGVPLRPVSREGIHEDLIFENFVPLENSGSFPCGHFIFGDLTRLGTSFPLWWLEALKKASDHLHLKAHVLSLRDCAFTGPHFQQTIIARIEKDLACVDPWVAKKLGPWSVSCGPDLYGALSSLKRWPSEELVDYSTPLPGRRMKKMFYFPHIDELFGASRDLDGHQTCTGYLNAPLPRL